MPYDWHNHITLADELSRMSDSGSGGEACIRLAVHARYYACFHLVRNYLVHVEKASLDPKHSTNITRSEKGTHELVIAIVGDPKRAQFSPAHILVAQNLQDLKALRIKADYHAIIFSDLEKFYKEAQTYTDDLLIAFRALSAALP